MGIDWFFSSLSTTHMSNENPQGNAGRGKNAEVTLFSKMKHRGVCIF